MESLYNASEDVDLLRFITAGSVDDGKSTLIGRLLYDSKSIFEDQLDAITSQLNGDVNLAHLTDGLRAEREQGITIDVAYRYFATPKRKFIIADSPGHVQYTRNMVTAASMSNLALIMIDARHGVTEQTRRHSFIASLLRIPHLVVCVNKMDAVDYAEEVFERIKRDFIAFAGRLRTRDVTFIPISALKGDNVVEPSSNMRWYRGSTVLYFLEEVHIASDRNRTDPVFPVQWVIKPKDGDSRYYSGQVMGGEFSVGDRIVALPSGRSTRIKSIHILDQQLETAIAPMSVAIGLEDELDISRGDTIVLEPYRSIVSNDLQAHVCWMSEEPAEKGRKYILKHCAHLTKAIVKDIDFRVNIESFDEDKQVTSLGFNEIGRLKLKTVEPLVYDAYGRNRFTGSFVLIDEVSHHTVAAGLLRDPERAANSSELNDYMI